MSIFERFKRRKKPEKVPSVAKALEGKEKPKRIKKKAKKKTPDLAYRVLISPHITEKARDLTKKNQYVFKIFPRTNKIEIKKAVEQIYGVDVLKVRIINIPKKPKRFGKTAGWKKGYKKAIVKIKEGQKIDTMAG